MKLLKLATLLIGAGFVTSVAAQDFPVTLTHEYGETTIAAKPERIATIGWMTQDVVLALGQVPVGVPKQEWGGDENMLLPWVTAKVAELGGELPVRYDDTAIPFEEILALDPDLILAPYSALTREEYDRLSQIAPTVAWTGAEWSGTWQDITLTVGKALGQEARAQELVAETDKVLADAATAHPEFAGKTFTIGWGDPGKGEIGIYVGSDPRVQMIEDLGLTLSDGARALTSESFYVPVSLENIDTLDADVLITWQSDQAELDSLMSNEVFARFGPVAEGRFIPMLDRSFVMATSAPSVLSIPWSVEKLVPELARVLAE
jgi:iron complex transport system substrate-binding protein